jgi:hypothetical protein
MDGMVTLRTPSRSLGAEWDARDGRLCKMSNVRPLIQAIIDELLHRHRAERSVDLNDIAEVIDARAVTYEEVEVIIDKLESEGLEVGEALSGYDVGVMRSVIVTAHRLRDKLRRSPTIAEIAEGSGHTPHAVRRALERAGSAGRQRLMM